MKRSTGKGSRGSRGLGAFKYIDPLNNHVVWPGREEALRSFIQQPYGGMHHKIRNAHSSNSEDACKHASNIDQCFGEHGIIDQTVATPIGVQPCRRFADRS
jgi:hypothetical protein